MGKLLNIVQTNLFGKKRLERDESRNTTAESSSDNDMNSSSSELLFPAGVYTIKSHVVEPREHFFANNDFLKELFVADVNKSSREEDMGEKRERKSVELGQGDNRMENVNIEEQKSLEAKFYELERCYLFEQNNTIDKYENEKAEMLAKHSEEKMLVKRAYEHEKDELRKEIERKDKMLFELTKLLKEEYSTKLERQKSKYESVIEEKDRLFIEVGDRLKSMIEELSKFVENNDVVSDVSFKFKHLLEEYEYFLDLIAGFNRKDLTETDSSTDSLFSDLNALKITQLAANTNNQSRKPGTELIDVKREPPPNPKELTRTMSDCIGLKNDCSRCRLSSHGDESIQHELAQAYRKQKSELVRLFTKEKEEYKANVCKEKDMFERETRNEYMKRMSVERKAWQETIEDYEREVAILKYERQQMDTNYCLGMDKMKTEFEREKNLLHRRYKESCMQWKRNIEEKMRTVKAVEELEKESKLGAGSVS